MPRKHMSQIIADEHASIGGVDGKKVFVVDDSGNQITDFGGEKLPIQGNNPSFNLNYDDNDLLTEVSQVINGTTYTKTLLWSGNSLVTVSAWV